MNMAGFDDSAQVNDRKYMTDEYTKGVLATGARRDERMSQPGIRLTNRW
jgi:hypothetical protein